MLDDEQRDAATVDLNDALEDHLEEARIDPRRRFVEQKQRRFCHQRAGEFEQLAFTSRKNPRGLAGEPIELDESEKVHRLVAAGALLAGHESWRDPVRPDALASLSLGP